MGTRSGIAVQHGDKIKAVYCHWDGYLEHNGAILDRYYDGAKANNLVALGDISSLGIMIGDKHPFSPHASAEDKIAYEAAKSEGWTTFYNRDRGETDVDFRVFFSEKEFIDGIDGEYFYLYRDEQWFVSTGAGFAPLKEQLQALNIDPLTA